MIHSSVDIEDDAHLNYIPEKSDSKKNVVVTGFGPFNGHPINASWEAVKLLPKYFDDHRVNLIIEEIPVKYNSIDEKVPELWKKYDPIVVIHAGVSHLAKNLTIERCAKQKGYCRKDVDGQIPSGQVCSFGLEEELQSSLDVFTVSKQINDMQSAVKTSISTSAGSYLCEYIYYTSLCHSRDRCLFVHVPKLGEPYRAEETAQGLSNIIRLVLNQISCNQVIENCF